jgi:hypothetical protein
VLKFSFFVFYVVEYSWQLLGKDSTDIDIALDNMTGQNFCERVNEYSEFLGEEQKGIGVIQWYAIFATLFLTLLILCQQLFVC